MSRRPEKPASRGVAQRTQPLRIVGGNFRGRKVPFEALPGLRPTPQRVRETLFNWLAPRIHGARGLDLFAGSGALGLEALSRGAARVTFVEIQGSALRTIEALAREWRIEPAQTSLVRADALAYLGGPREAFDVVFLDPPFDTALIAPCIARLADGWLTPGALVYVEQARTAELPAMPPGWIVHRSGQAGEVGYHLLRSEDAA